MSFPGAILGQSHAVIWWDASRRLETIFWGEPFGLPAKARFQAVSLKLSRSHVPLPSKQRVAGSKPAGIAGAYSTLANR